MGILIGGPTPEDGLSAYQIWLNLGNTGTEQDFILSLKGLQGNDGNDGNDGNNGLSNYQIWLNNGHTGSQTDYLNWLKADVTNMGQVMNWDMGVGTASAQNVLSGNGNYIKIGGLVQVCGTILPSTPGTNAMKVQLPFAPKNRISRMQIANKGIFGGTNDSDDNIYAIVNQNSTILQIVVLATSNPSGLFGFSFSYITDYNTMNPGTSLVLGP